MAKSIITEEEITSSENEHFVQLVFTNTNYVTTVMGLVPRYFWRRRINFMSGSKHFPYILNHSKISFKFLLYQLNKKLQV